MCGLDVVQWEIIGLGALICGPGILVMLWQLRMEQRGAGR